MTASARWKGLLKLGLMILVAQAIFWGLFNAPWGSTSAMRDLNFLNFSAVELAELPAPTPQAAANATYEKINLPYTDCCDPAYLSLRLTFPVTDVPQAGLGVIASQQVDNFIFVLNGSIVHQQGRMTFGEQTFHGQRPYLIHLPEGLLKTGDNQLTIITVRHGFPYTDLGPPRIAEYTQVRDATALRFWQFYDYRLLCGVLTFILGLFALIMIFRAQEKLFAGWLLVLCWSWTAYSAYGLWLDIPVSGIGRMVTFFTITSLLTVSLIGFIDAWTRRPVFAAHVALMTLWLGYCGFTVYALNHLPMPQGFDIMDQASQWFGFIGGCLVLVRLLWHFATQAEDRVIEAALLSICAVCNALDGIGAKFGLNVGGYLLESAAVLLLAFVIAFLQRNFHLFQSAIALNKMLESNLRKREAELAKAHDRERLLIDRQARNEERRRLMRDMHDGVGGQLVGLLLEVRRGAIDHQRMAEGLQVAMDEIRLMIDSVDATGTTLDTMLGVFESRLRPRIQGTGIDFIWTNTVDSAIDMPPPTVLQVFRIMQEAVTNAMKHAEASEICVDVATEDDTLVIQISDNGTGLGPSPEKAALDGGHGLGNMRARAIDVGGQLEWQDNAPGTRVVLKVPVSAAVTTEQA
ncbi:ATP-binding protein [uncultured Brevundimonas sp.]|uniref:sensor histidine kinase n=1 Tax=uncultured Brevundimonas sp. TaxID=213418 RepID=UPI00260F515C|nr:ATP-binding protein [uncultured Brevundimonas sp.]